MSIKAIVFPFDLFGSAGTGAGAQLLGDALEEMLVDAKREAQPARSHAFRDSVRLEEFLFDNLSDCHSWKKTARRAVGAARQSLDRVLFLAGNHLGVLPIYEELGRDALVLQFDAHLDIFNLTDSTEEPSHGNFLLHAEGPMPTIVNVGSRDLFLPQEHSGKHFRGILSAESIARDADKVVAQLTLLCKKAKSIWIDIDCDVFDPAYFPAVQNPLPMGLSPAFVLRVLSTLWSDKIAGVSLSEFDPGRDRNDQSLGTLIWLMEWCLLKWTEE
jgi:agmatinase